MQPLFLYIIVILIVNAALRIAKNRKNTPGARPQPTPVSMPQPEPAQAQTGRPRVLRRQGSETGTAPNMPRRVVPYKQTNPERVTEGAMRFGGRPDLEPGYMYLNGVRVLIKEADKLEFLR